MGKAPLAVVFATLALLFRFLVGWVVILFDKSDLSPFTFFSAYPVLITLLVAFSAYLVAIYWLKQRAHFVITGICAALIACLVVLPGTLKLGGQVGLIATSITALEWLVVGVLAHLGMALVEKAKPALTP